MTKKTRIDLPPLREIIVLFAEESGEVTSAWALEGRRSHPPKLTLAQGQVLLDAPVHRLSAERVDMPANLGWWTRHDQEHWYFVCTDAGLIEAGEQRAWARIRAQESSASVAG